MMADSYIPNDNVCASVGISDRAIEEMRVSVIVPTYRRPESLKNSLLSIRHQSRKDLIAEIIVSENSDDSASSLVVDQFSDLPISFVRRHPPLSPGHHFYVAASEAEEEWVAMLADDDTWGRYHLEEACRSLCRYPQAHAYACQTANVRGPNRRIQFPSWLPMSTFTSHSHSFYSDAWIWGPEQSAVECLIRTSINLWGVVARKQPYLRALAVFLDDNPGIDADRYLLWRLFSEGQVVIGHEASLFYCYHDESATAKTFYENLDHNIAMSAEYTRRIISECRAKGIDVKKEWKDRLEKLDSQTRSAFWNAPFASTGAQSYLREVWPDLVGQFCIVDSSLKKILRQVTPPLIWRFLQDIRHKFRS
jgi:glycosyltransferase involved in cell wall biosynthesis